MALQPGKRLGPYEIVAPIGAGGMGEVYRARDTRLERDVAIKVLPQHLANNPQFKLRAASIPEGQPVTPLSADELVRLRESGHATYWDTSKGPYLPGVPHQ
jgi:serine/threonine protein kinase